MLVFVVGCTNNTANNNSKEIVYELTDREIVFEEVSIPFYLIDNIKDVPIIPSMKLLEGIEDGNFRKGLFEVEGHGKVHMYVNDINQKMILIDHNNERYGITPGIDESFDEFRYNLIVSWELTYK